MMIWNYRSEIKRQPWKTAPLNSARTFGGEVMGDLKYYLYHINYMELSNFIKEEIILSDSKMKVSTEKMIRHHQMCQMNIKLKYQKNFIRKIHIKTHNALQYLTEP